MKKFILVTDPIASPEHLLERFTEAGYQLIALQILPEQADWLSYQTLPFFKVLRSSGNVLNDAQRIKTLTHEQLIAGFYGLSASIGYADKLFNYLFPDASNPLATSLLRQSKYTMTQKLNSVFHLGVNQLQLSANEKLDSLLSRAEEFFNENNHSIIIKPAQGSAMSTAVYFPDNIADIAWYFKHGEKPLFSLNSDYLLQERLTGRQFYVNTASYRGKHRVIDAGVYEKMILNKEVHCLYDEPISIHAALYHQLAQFTIQVLKLIEMNNGLGHVEIAESKNGFVLIETNLRVAGALGFLNKMAKNQIHVDQIDDFISLLENRPFKKRSVSASHQRLIMIRRCTAAQYEHIKKLKTYADSAIYPELSQQKHNTPKIIGILLLKSLSKAAVIADYEQLIAMGLVLPDSASHNPSP